MGGLALGSFAPAYADDTVTVQGTQRAPIPRAPSSPWWAVPTSTGAPARILLPRVGAGPGAAPAGSRSLGWDLAGGNAVGALFTVGSMLSTTTTASLAVNAAGRTTGVADAGYGEPGDAGASRCSGSAAPSW